MRPLDIDLCSLSMASELNMLHEASCRKRVAPWLYALVRKSFGAQVRWCDALDAREALLGAHEKALAIGAWITGERGLPIPGPGGPSDCPRVRSAVER